MTQTRLQHFHVLYIRTTPEKLWDALVKPEQTREYFHGTEISSKLTPGSSVDYLTKDEKGETVSALNGKIVEIVPGRKLVHTFSFPHTRDRPSRASYEIEPMGDLVKLTVTHDGFEGETQTYKETSAGWPILLSSLKSLLETGEALPTRGVR